MSWSRCVLELWTLRTYASWRSLRCSSGPERIAIVGMACRFPGARGVEEFWRVIREGIERAKG